MKALRLLQPFMFIFFMNTFTAQSIYPNDWCETATLVLPSDVKSGTLGLANIDPANCNNSSPVLGIWFKYEGNGELLEVNLSGGEEWQINITVFEGDCSDLICLPYADHRFLTEVGKTYYILLGKNYGNFSNISYNLTFTQKPKVDYDICNGALLLGCGQSAELNLSQLTSENIPRSCNDLGAKFGWVEIRGDGNTYSLNWNNANVRLKIFEKDCDSLKCLNYNGYGDILRFSTKENKDYLIAFFEPYAGVQQVINVSVSCQPNDAPNVCANATTISCGESIQTNVNEFWASDLLTSDYRGHWFKSNHKGGKHIFELNLPDFLQVTLQTFRSIGDDCGDNLMIVDDVYYGYNNVQYVVNALENESVYIKISSFQSIDFSLSLLCEEKADTNFDCQSASQVACGDTLDLYTVKEDYEKICGNFERKGLWFLFNGSSDPYVFSSLSNAVRSVGYKIYTSDCDSLQCIKEGEFIFNQNRNVYIDLPEGQQYYIKFLRNSYDFQRFKFKINCPAQIDKNVFCENAKEITCFEKQTVTYSGGGISVFPDSCNLSDGQWYTFVGDDQIYNLRTDVYSLSVSLYEGNCDQLSCIFKNQIYSYLGSPKFKAELGKTYYLKVWTTNLPSADFFLNCVTEDPNNSCSSPFELTCGDSTLITINHNVTYPLTVCDQTSGGWYRITGRDKLVSITNANDAIITVFTGTCDTLECLYRAYSNVSFYANNNVFYYVNFISLDGANKFIHVNCYDVPIYDCDTPKPLVCGDTLNINFDKSPNDKVDGDRFYSKVQWFSFVGNGQSMIFNSPFGTEPIYNVRYEVYEDNCENLISTNNNQINFFDYTFTKIIVNTKVGTIYRIKFLSYNDVLSLVTSCIETVPNQTCNEALSLTCGQNYTYDPKNRTNGDLSIQNRFFQTAWYKYESAGEVFSLKINQDNNGIYKFSVFESVSGCDSLIEQIENVFVTNDNAWNYATEVGKTYIIQFGMNGDFHGDNPFFPDFKVNFSIDCAANISPDMCTEAIAVSCDSSYNTKSVFTMPSTFGDCTVPTNGTWYTINGDGNIYNFLVQNEEYLYQYNDVIIGRGSCDSLTCIESFDINESSRNFSLATEEGIQYYFKFINQGYGYYDYKFKVFCDTTSTNYNCASAISTQCGEIIGGNTTGLEPDSANICNETSTGLYYHLRGNGQYVVFELTELTTSDLRVSIFEKSCAADGRCLFETTMSKLSGNKIILNTKNNTDYYIKFGEASLPNPSFRIKLSCVDEPENLSCVDANTLSCGDTTSISLATPLGYNSNLPCYWESDIINYWYLLPKTDQLIEIEILEGDQYAYFSLISGNCSENNCVYTYSRENSKIVFQQEGTQDYYLNVFGQKYTVGDLKFILKCIDPAENDSCQNPIAVQCGDEKSDDLNYATFGGNQPSSNCVQSGEKDLWYSFVGTGDVFKFLFGVPENFYGLATVYEKGECGSLVCTNYRYIRPYFPENELKFVTEPNKEYLISIQGNNTFSFQVSCLTPLANDLCSGAYELNTDGSTEVIIQGSTPDFIPNCSFNNFNGVWYTIEGNDSILIIENQNGIYDFKYILLEGECNNFRCISSGLLYDYSRVSFYAAPDKKYFLFLYGSNAIIRTKAYPYAENNICSDATSISCNDSVIINNVHYINTPNSSDQCQSSYQNAAWYKMVGTDEIVVFDFPAQELGTSLTFVESCGGSCIYTHNVNPYEPSSFRLTTELNKTYYFKFNVSNNILDKTAYMYTRCEAGLTNVSPPSAEDVVCKSYSLDVSNPSFSISDQCISSYYQKYWYKFAGDGSLFKFASPMLNMVSAEIKDENCQTLHYFNFQSSSFMTEPGKQYYLVIYYPYQSQIDLVNFEIQYQCIDNIDDVNVLFTNIKVTPNPFSQNCVVTFDSKIKSDGQYEIFDVNGRLVLKSSLKMVNGTNTIDLNSDVFPFAGVYNLKISSNNGSNQIRLVMIR